MDDSVKPKRKVTVKKETTASMSTVDKHDFVSLLEQKPFIEESADVGIENTDGVRVTDFGKKMSDSGEGVMSDSLKPMTEVCIKQEETTLWMSAGEFHDQGDAKWIVITN
jgi:hypothetical protein